MVRRKPVSRVHAAVLWIKDNFAFFIGVVLLLRMVYRGYHGQGF